MSLNYDPKLYLKTHNKLRRKLMNIAFNKFYHCDQCGCHSNLQIHFLNYSSLDNIDLISYRILCSSCHSKLKKHF